MRSKLLHQAADGLQTFVLIFDTGDEVLGTLKSFATEHRLAGAHFTGIGALERTTVAWFDWTSKQYMPIAINEQVEVLALVGDVATAPDGKPAVHAHLTIAKRDGTAHGGHLRTAIVRPTLEVILTETAAHLRKTVHDESGLPLIDLTK